MVELQPLDRILLCSDGMYNSIDDETLLHTLQCAKDVETVAERYREICREKAGDNYTGIVVEMEDPSLPLLRGRMPSGSKIYHELKNLRI